MATADPFLRSDPRYDSVLSVDREGMTVQFDDRADTTRIRSSDKAWMDFISVVRRAHADQQTVM